MVISGLQGPKIGKTDPPESFFKYVHGVTMDLEPGLLGSSSALSEEKSLRVVSCVICTFTTAMHVGTSTPLWVGPLKEL